MQTIAVNTSSRDYNVYVGCDLLKCVGSHARKTAGGDRAFVVSNTDVAPLYAQVVMESLEQAGYATDLHVVAASETVKNMKELSNLLEAMAEVHMTRDDVVVALGGGVVGDLAGFAAAVYMRGCKYIQVPTSLLAMVDSSVGGKTAVDLGHGKNLAGAFYQPRVVVASIECLDTIDANLFADSCGEVIKYGVMCDPSLFDELEARPLTASKDDHARLAEVIARCVSIKRDVVNADEHESGIRQTLNLGHTIGHAVEAAYRYEVGHGTCVAIGLCMMARACAKRGWCASETAARIERVVEAHGLPTSAPFTAEELFEYALSDKKRHGDHMNVVSIEKIGSVLVNQLDLMDFNELIVQGLDSAR